MKKKNLLLILSLLVAVIAKAQTWNGSAGTSWNVAANWTPATVPGPTSTVTIPNTANKPVLQNNVTLTDITTSLGSAIDFNGFTLTVSGNFDLNGSTLNNANAATDISITLNGGSILYFRQNVVNDNIIINHNSATGFYEGYQYPDTFNGSATFNINGTGIFYTSYDNVSTFNGNVTVNRTVAGPTYIFNIGATAVTGNFSYTNNAGGLTSIHASGVPSVPVTGTVNITATGTGNPDFSMDHIINQTTGGTVSVQNSGLVTMTRDTLLVTALNVNSFTGAGLDDFLQNQITGTVNISDNASNTGSIYFRGNTVNGATTITVNSASALYEAYQFPDTFNGNVTINSSAGGLLSICYDNPSTFNGNVTINRTVAGVTEIFRIGAVAVTGNFSYTNNAGGNTTINLNGATKVPISGTINITATGTGNPTFSLERIQNNTTGGTISVQNSGFVTIANDTLLLSALNVNGFTGANTDDFLQNQITGTVNISDAASNSGSIYFRGNTVNGATTITVNSASALYEAYQYPDIFNGNLFLNRNNGSVFFSYDNPSIINQNLTINSASGISFTQLVKFGGNTAAIIEQSGTQPIIIPLMQIQKTGAGSLTLNDAVTVGTTLTFSGGNIISSSLNPLIFSDNATQTGASVSSHVKGVIRKVGDDAFTFPTGTDNSLNTVVMTAPALATDAFSAEYLKKNPTSDGYDTSLHAPTLQRISGCEYWLVNRVAGTSNVTLTFSFAPPCSGSTIYISNPAQVRIARWTGSTWENLGNGGSTGTTTGTVTTAAAVSNFSPFTFGSVDINVNPLPVTLLSFAASKCNSGVCLLWVTENEQNFSYYEVEKSTDGIVFSRVTNVSARNTGDRASYSSRDITPANGVNYYRLKIMDLDGSFKYSRIVKVDLNKREQASLLPNPATDVVIISGLAGYQQIRIIDMAGKIRQQKNVQSSIEEINISHLSKGMYLVQLISDNETTTIKLVKQ